MTGGRRRKKLNKKTLIIKENTFSVLQTNMEKMYRIVVDVPHGGELNPGPGNVCKWPLQCTCTGLFTLATRLFIATGLFTTSAAAAADGSR
jgi:hypothetical protein